MKKNNLLKNSIHLISILSALLITISCENIYEQNNSEKKQVASESKTYLSVQVQTSSKGRTVNPVYVTGPEDFSSFTLTGYFEEETEPSLIISQPSYSDFQAETTTREITAGNWIFIMEAVVESNSITYKDRISAAIKKGESNFVTFNLKPTGDAGISITMTLEDNTGIDKVIATLRNLNDETVDSKEFDISTKTGADRNITYSKTPVTPDTYKILFEFFAGTNQVKPHQGNDPTPINQWESYVKVVEGVTTSDTINLNFNSVYTITYQDKDGNEINFANESLSGYSGIAITKYSVRSDFDLPVCTPPENSRQVFAGWTTKLNGDLSDANAIKKITKGTASNLILKPYFADPVIYVSGTGDDSVHGFNSTYPLESVDKACEIIKTVGYENLDWTIKINGDVTGPHTGTNKAGSRDLTNDYGMSTVPSTVTTEHAKSITLIGANDLVSGVPQDMINRGLRIISGAGGSDTGVALSIQTSVPVTIKQLKLTNGNNSTTNPSSEAVYNTGGGLCIASGATVKLTDGVMISHNTATYGGAISNAGTLFIYGNVVLGDDTKTTPASGYDEGNSSNYGSSCGGGIYNKGKLYLGYSDYISDTENTPVEWSGSITYNFSPTGGALYNTNGGEVIMKTGTLKYNTHGNSGAGGGAVYNIGSFTMEGGSIEHNKSIGKHGAGVFNAYDNTKGTGIFNFAGGEIKGNNATFSYGTASSGGGVYNTGIMYMYGNAVVGDSSAGSEATSSNDCSNFASCYGGGICVSGSNAKLYMGYKSYTSETVNETEPLSGGIYYNYVSYDTSVGGGGLAIKDNGTVVMHSGTITNNGALKNGAGVYVDSDGFTICGTPEISGEIWNANSRTLNIGDNLATLTDGILKLTPTADTGKTLYYDNQPVIKLTSGAAAAGVTLANVIPKFTITPLVTTATGQTTNWYIDETTGIIKRKSSSGTSTSLDVGTADIVVYRNGYGFTPPISATDTTGTICLDVKKVAGKDYSSSTMTLVWTFDGEILTRDSMPEGVSFRYSSNDCQIDIDSSKLDTGSYDVSVEATYNGELYSFTTQIIKN